MVVEEHLETARYFIEESDSYFANGDVLQGSEKTWGAAAHIVMAAAQQRGWPFGTHRALNIAVRRLADEYDDPSLELAFGVAQKFHANFYHKFMEDFEYDSGRPAVRQFVEKMQALMDED
ncbi:MAG: PaREP1/PaREP8 domain-contain protein [Dehalococcoidia bacterium]|nr:PaREP1/PaREP8 domain-contain protein [Dehalococcoidia bacterium]